MAHTHYNDFKRRPHFDRVCAWWFNEGDYLFFDTFNCLYKVERGITSWRDVTYRVEVDQGTGTKCLRRVA